ncbi:4-(cytidine 5'-diphospho)-2-C-methyl-D-erythritol kinase [Candidatus Endowatersipora endosymbiont of Watersipora subatra]|uniref:4-(cytidine 5'-diphospho)-2-C-methyl-D-erythritol kinase n=1 Tax=Candidatus Endowatersipora endosymbiont of Watersipora subatra TaxID=3077946 RepID=UPI00312CC251
MFAFAPAKINLYLHILGQRQDGYHFLKTLVVFCDVGDRITVIPSQRQRLRLRITGPFACHLPVSSSNLVWRAAKMLYKMTSGPKAHAILHLEKKLPVASGLGGGSADAAATLRILTKFWKMNSYKAIVEERALTLGADVPMCLSSIPAYISGIGEIIQPVLLPSLSLVLVNPGRGLSTADVFKKPDLSPPKKNLREMQLKSIPIFTNSFDLVEYLSCCHNSLERVAKNIMPEICKCLDALSSQSGLMLSRMSGAGPTCFGIFSKPEDAQQARIAIASQYPQWWVQYTQTRTQRVEENFHIKKGRM